MANSATITRISRLCLIVLWISWLQVQLPLNTYADTEASRCVIGPWVKGIKIGPQTDASGRRFYGCVFVGLDLSNAIFDDCDFFGASICQCNFRNASFKRANMNGLRFGDCELDGADFTDAIINGIERFDGRHGHDYQLTAEQFTSTYSYKAKRLADCFIDVALENRKIVRCKFDFRNADLSRTILEFGDFTQSDFTDACIDGIKMIRCRVTFQQLSATRNFKAGALRDMRIGLHRRTDFTGIDLTGSDLCLDDGRQAKLTDAIINRCTVYGWLAKEQLYSTRNYQEGNLSGITFMHVDMSDWDLSRQNLSGCWFENCKFTDVNMNDAVISGVRFRDKGPPHAQLKSTWNYKHQRMASVVLPKELADALSE